MTDDANAPKHSNTLTYWIAGAIVVAIAVALLWPHFAMHFDIGGELFLRSLKMIVVPLVFTSVMCGILGLGDVRRLGKPGATAVGYYLCTTVLAVIVGLIVVNVLRPGVGTVDKARLQEFSQGSENPKQVLRRTLAEESGLTEAEVAGVLHDLPAVEDDIPSTSKILENLALMLVTDNLFQAAAEMQLLPIIVFTICFGALLTTMPNRTRSITTLISEANDALLAFVMILMKIAPLGIFCLVTARFGKAQAEGKFMQEIGQIGWYFAAVLIGLAIHAFIVLPLIFWIVRRENPYRYAAAMSQALLTAFSTASSSATLPVTLECAESAGISKRSSEFVIPLGATINMDGTALYEAAAAIFIAQVIGQDLSMSQQVIVAVTATLAAIGAAGIPEAGLVTMLIVLNAVGLPLEYIGLILSVDWLLDRFRTAVNVFGDSVGAAVVAVTIPEDEIPEPPAYAPTGQ
ncbi:dicarboxylate/amino acid:cation symporter [Allorhodopirellula heiligendammensis]|uniref:Proton glutamate symport protein n=1 Tax=Allorhodopirellula heiligendammensis TaxID=2714739 RepID=A0A5C6BET3_9BACT|nr:dicarboxylate/amino acid:cation symporter [Allorhodopirellula heiligendammensis]TWU10001.1 Proton glutamate symport protein [Allorhodopirellula heiligendammensis]